MIEAFDLYVILRRLLLRLADSGLSNSFLLGQGPLNIWSWCSFWLPANFSAEVWLNLLDQAQRSWIFSPTYFDLVDRHKVSQTKKQVDVTGDFGNVEKIHHGEYFVAYHLLSASGLISISFWASMCPSWVYLHLPFDGLCLLLVILHFRNVSHSALRWHYQGRSPFYWIEYQPKAFAR